MHCSFQYLLGSSVQKQVFRPHNLISLEKSVNGRIRAIRRSKNLRENLVFASQAPGLQRLPSSGDLRRLQPDATAPAPAASVIEPFSLSIAQLQSLIELANNSKVYGLGVVSSADELAKRLGSSVKTGISGAAADIAQRRELYGMNSLPQRTETTFWEYVLEALDDFTVRILIIAGIVSIYLQTILDTTNENGWIEGAAILAAVVVVVLVTAVNNFQKERQFKQLNDMQSDVTVRVIRSGKEVEISGADLLVGDVLCLETGDILQADGVLLNGHNVRLDESNLTGESQAMKKDPVRSPALYSGSKVLEGLGRMMITAVGCNSQQGLILTLATQGSQTEPEDAMGLRQQTNLQNQLEVLAQQIGGLGLVAGLLAIIVSSATFTYDTFAVQQLPWSWTYLNNYLHFVILGITILVVAIPEGLPLAVTIGLAYSVKRMLADNNLVRHLGAAETMGCATTICCDKTGTLTQNDMAVVRAYVAGEEVKDAKKTRTRLSERKQQLAAEQVAAEEAQQDSGGANADDDDASAAAAAAVAERVESGSQASTSGSNGSGKRSNGSLLTTFPSYSPPTVTPAAAVLPLDNIDPRTVQLLCDAIAVNSTAQLVYDTQTGQQEKRGSRTECALLEFVEGMGGDVKGIRDTWEVTHLFPFSSERKRMSTLAYQAAHRLDGMTCAKLFVKGAAEIVLSMCDNQLCADGSVKSMSEEEKQQLLASFGKDGRRMLCIAYRDMMLPSWHEEEDPPPVGEQQAEQHLTFLAMCGLEDPLRPEVKQAIKQLQRAGITVRMLTGDNAITAFSIARQCGIVPKQAPLPKYVSGGQGAAGWKKKVLEYLAEQQDGNGATERSTTSVATSAAAQAVSVASAKTVNQQEAAPTQPNGNKVVNGVAGGSTSLASASLTSSSGTLLGSIDGRPTNPDDDFLVMESSLFQKLILNADGTINYQAFDVIWPKLRVLARCTPLDKYTIVNACKNRPTEVVAMTGDGTNDAPALRLANVGFAMASGTSIAKEASDILLLDDNLNSIVQAVKWGRNVYAGATKFLQFQLTINIGAVVTATLGAFVLRDSPLAAIQMLWINLVMDSLASLSLATETPSDEVLDQPPYATDSSLVTPTVLKNIAGQTVFQLAVMYWIVFVSPSVLGYADGSGLDGPSVHYTMVFNTFVMMQLFNQVNARKLRDEHNILDGLAQDQLFLGVLGAEAVIQYLLVEYGGQAFNCQPLDAQQWGVCIGFGATGLLIREVLRYIHVDNRQSDPDQVQVQ